MEIRKACRWKHPRAPSARNMFGDEIAIEAALAFEGHQDRAYGHDCTLGGEGKAVEGERGGPGPP